jgi:hypothetical protein
MGACPYLGPACVAHTAAPLLLVTPQWLCLSLSLSSRVDVARWCVCLFVYVSRARVCSLQEELLTLRPRDQGAVRATRCVAVGHCMRCCCFYSLSCSTCDDTRGGCGCQLLDRETGTGCFSRVGFACQRWSVTAACDCGGCR